MKHPLIGLLTVLPLISGCGTTLDLVTVQRVYGGVRVDAEAVDRPYLPSAHAPVYFFPILIIGILDFPISLALDTALLPVTATLALVRPPQEEKKYAGPPSKGPRTPEELRQANLRKMEDAGSTPSEQIAAALDLTPCLWKPDFEPVLAAFVRVSRSPVANPGLHITVLSALLYSTEDSAFDAAMTVLRGQESAPWRQQVLLEFEPIAQYPDKYRSWILLALKSEHPETSQADLEKMTNERVPPRRLKLLDVLESVEERDTLDHEGRIRGFLKHPWFQ